MNNLYESSRIKGSFFNKMIHCGTNSNIWVENALEYLPQDILDENKDNIAFISTRESHACRLSRHLCEKREIIVISECIFPKNGSAEDKKKVRYFTFVILHEVAHAIKKHKSPLFDELTQGEIQRQEKEADDLAISWFNNHVELRNNKLLKPITHEEIDRLKRLFSK